jgi:hypothetical protein
MRLAYSLASAALLSAGCSLDFDTFEPIDGSASDATMRADASEGGLDAVGGDGAGAGGPACTGTSASCGSACVSSCASCNGGTDFVTCMVCADGGPPVFVCGSADPNGFCLDGNYGHCPCQQDSDCPASNLRCTNNQCTACGEPLFNQSHTRCVTNGNCCKSGANLGKCSC